MWIPPPDATSLYPSKTYTTISGSHGDHNGGTGSQLRQWSSLTGIVTAIVGNVLISFALNTQRYAHIRIEREYNQGKSTRRLAKNSSDRRHDYGTTAQDDVAEERSRLNARAPGPGGPKKQTNTEEFDEVDDDVDGENVPLKTSYQSKASEKDDDDENDGRKSYLRSGWWWVGIIMMTIGEAGNFLAYGFAPASVVSPLGVVALISNCLIAPLILKERFRQRDLWGVLVAIAGAVTIVFSAKQEETKMGPDDVWDAINRWEFLLYLGLTAGAIIALMIASPKYGDRTLLIDLGLVGLFGGYTAISTKGVASLLSDTLWKTFTFPITYLLVAVLVISAVMQIRYVNRALQRFDSTQVIPTQFVMFTIFVIISSAVLYREFESTTASRVGLFIGGCLLTFSGVYLITSGRSRGGDEVDDDEDDSDEDVPINLVDEEAESQRHKSRSARKLLDHVDDRPTTPSPHMNGDSSYQPSMATTTESMPSSMRSGGIDQASAPPPIPYNRSHSDVPSTPPNNRTQSTTETPYYTPATTAPVRPENPALLLRTPSGPADPETPTRASRTASPPKPDQAVRPPATPARSNRGSIARLTPGPFITPLSSSLSGIVADSLRRGEGTSRSNRMRLRRGRSSQNQEARRRSQADVDGLSRQQTLETEPEFDVTDVVEGEGSTFQKQSRLRSMSETLGGLIGGGRSKRRKKDQEDGGGPSAAA